jgi:hypothetical protein
VNARRLAPLNPQGVSGTTVPVAAEEFYSMAHDTQATFIGSVGVALLLIAFLLNLFKLLRSDAHVYMGLNLVGAGLACYSSWLISFMPFVVLEGVWAIVALAAIARMLLIGRSATP